MALTVGQVLSDLSVCDKLPSKKNEEGHGTLQGTEGLLQVLVHAILYCCEASSGRRHHRLLQAGQVRHQ